MATRSPTRILNFVIPFLFGTSTLSTPLRHSPEVSDLIVSSLRSSVVLPGNRLARKSASVCDSLIDGPFCGIVSSKPKPSTGGLIDTEIWGGNIPRRLYDLNYNTISQFAQINWSGLPGNAGREPRISTLHKEGFEFVINPIQVDHMGFTATEDEENSSVVFYKVNSNYGYVSFLIEVSVIEMVVKAPANSHILVRAFSDGVSIWSRVVKAGTSNDVSRPCSEIDPSMESVDHLEVVGVGAELHALSVSTSSEPVTKTYVYMDSDLSKPSRYSGIRTFPSSAYLVDMERASTEGLYFMDPWETLPPAKSAILEDIFSSSNLIDILEHTASDMQVPIPQLDYFIHLLDRRAAPDSITFEDTFRDLLIEGSVEVLSFILQGSINIPTLSTPSDSRAHQLATRLRLLRGDEPDPSPLKIVTLQAPTSPILEEAANTVALALFAHLGRDKFEEIVLRSKLVRLTNAERVMMDGIDEPALLAIIVEGLGLQFDEATPEPNRRSTVSQIIEILLEGSSVASAGTDLVDHLFP